MTSFAEKCLCLVVEKDWDMMAKILLSLGIFSKRAIFLLCEKDKEELLLSILQDRKDAVVEHAIQSGDFSYIHVVFERMMFDDLEKALSFSIKHHNFGLSRIFVGMGAQKQRHVKEYCMTKKLNVPLGPFNGRKGKLHLGFFGGIKSFLKSKRAGKMKTSQAPAVRKASGGNGSKLWPSSKVK
ncbi:hypothetical protein GMAR_ORF150 [Golden Marseillevirus]|uniref:hypothetical protein n=1 Tax=Golden Marseillevirus TaxID=1720526 RepID=UPI000877AB98|nr:hypothetical protein GMAR_ORF150 [Golden Marseillevirus]ALX27524.1 hypothetical protein GMAR_ORF150 [Golden Marseillevirus]